MKFGCCISKIDDLIRVKAAGYVFFEFAGCTAAAMSESEFDALCAEQARTGLPCIGFNAYSAGIPEIIGHNVSDSATASYAELLCRRGKRLGIRVGAEGEHVHLPAKPSIPGCAIISTAPWTPPRSHG